ncbi:MAG TPA: DUF3108 domain-containing protein [Pseudolabrys sp.]
MIAANRGTLFWLSAFLAFGLPAAQALADTRLIAHYAISMTGVSVGQLTWTIDVATVTGVYRASANGKASGPLSVLVNGEGRVAARGTLVDGQPTPGIFTSNVTEDGETTGLQMTFENGSVKTLRSDAALRKNDGKEGRVPVTEADMRGVTDPLSGMTIAAPAGDLLAAQNCDRVVAIFDGQRRYNLALSFKRVDKLKIERGYAGPVLVCAVMLRPIAGHRADSMLVKYVSGQRGMEIWFAPIASTDLAAPARLVMPTIIGTLEIDADRFETAATGEPGGGSPPKP